ncbi:MAG TPA: penicillin acylase family protein [Dokdonella sp.]|uniref:penicillin acylase family protein n=1 Tax=Dokdonella sp. TaxID=2291710 RepID=UPI002D80268D|nr:penicillin acylase family protein [Dokdonella sp.]HET9034016.1 penicillin acylase family protein [Dokdonella sp.]
MKKPARWLLRLTGLILLLIIALVVAAWLALRGSLPQLDGSVQTSMLNAATRIERDALGTVTIIGENRADVTWALGYVHAQERFFEMDLMRRSAAGELAELFGPAALPIDRRARVHRMRARAEATLALSSEADRNLIDSYRDGVNAGLAALDVRPFAYLLTRNTPRPWSSADSLLVIDAMYFTLNDAQNRRELAFSRMKAALPESAFNFLTATGGWWDAPLSGPEMRWPEPPPAVDIDLRALDRSLLKHEPSASDVVPGSNSFAVSGALTGGPGLIANDMHLELRVPGIWFRARLIFPNPRHPGETIDVSGASLPGTPAIVAGSNRSIAWGFTNSYGDFADWVRVIADPSAADHYLTAEGSAAIETHEESIAVHGGAAESLLVRETRWGPILAEDVDGTPLALAWTAEREGALNIEPIKLETAETADEAVAIVQRAGMPAQNFLVVDRFGSIAWTIAGRIPQRVGGFDPQLPADWSQPGTGWNGWLDPSDYPLISNPPWQRLWTANARIVDEGKHLDLLGDGGYDLGARQRQIRDDLRAKEHFSVADMLDIQLDDRALFLDPWRKQLLSLLEHSPSTPQRSAIRDALADWDGHASIDSVSYRIVRGWRNEVKDTVLDAFAGAVRIHFADFRMPKLAQSEHAVWMLLQRRPPNLLPPGYQSWDALQLDALDRVADSLQKQPGGIAAQTWGERNTARIAHPLSRALPGFLARLLDMPADQLPGDSNMPRVQGPAFGASERFAVAPGDEEHGYFELPSGQSGHPLSPFYGAGHRDWVEGKPTPFLPGPAIHRLRFEPIAH